jgi:hypothetical protein
MANTAGNYKSGAWGCKTVRANWRQTVSVFLGDGDGTLEPVMTYGLDGSGGLLYGGRLRECNCR